jgi:hypothetical protein
MEVDLFSLYFSAHSADRYVSRSSANAMLELSEDLWKRFDIDHLLQAGCSIVAEFLAGICSDMDESAARDPCLFEEEEGMIHLTQPAKPRWKRWSALQEETGPVPDPADDTTSF